MGLDRFVDHATNAAIEAALGARVRLPIAALGPVLEVAFPMAMTPRDVPHGLGVVPDGFWRILESEGVVVATQVTDWTADVAFLQASDANTIARVQFFILEKGVLRHVVPS